MKKSRIIPALILNLYIIISMLVCLIRFVVASGQGNMQVHGFAAFRFFTVDSNCLMAIASCITIYHLIRCLTNSSHRIPFKLELFNFIAVTSVAVTFVTVCTILGPAAGFLSMFTGNNLMMHLINPLAAIASFMFFTADNKIKWQHTPIAIITTFIYGILYFIMVVVVGKDNGGWDDFYYFNTATKWYISFTVMQIMAYLIGLILKAVHNHTYNKGEINKGK